MSKRKKQARRLSPAITLRPRLDKLWAEETLPNMDEATIGADLDAVAKGVKPDFLMQTMLRAYLSATEASRARLDEVLPGWLRRQGYTKTLQEVVTDLAMGDDLRPPALAWLEAGGIDTQPLIEEWKDLFFEAYYYDDASQFGGISQATVAVFWYTSPKRDRAQAITFLLDYNPPWDGSVKDADVLPQRRPSTAIHDYLALWARGGMEPEPVSAERAKTVILTALHCNRKSEIRLPRDLVAQRALFSRQVLSLPDGADTPPFTMDDFDALANRGKRPEEISLYEQTVGRRVRMGDGKEVLVMGDPDWEEEA